MDTNVYSMLLNSMSEFREAVIKIDDADGVVFKHKDETTTLFEMKRGCYACPRVSNLIYNYLL